LADFFGALVIATETETQDIKQNKEKEGEEFGEWSDGGPGT
jgi:hypothetical protein